MLLQVAVKDIGQLTDFEPWPTSRPSLAVYSGGMDMLGPDIPAGRRPRLGR